MVEQFQRQTSGEPENQCLEGVKKYKIQGDDIKKVHTFSFLFSSENILPKFLVSIMVNILTY